MVSALAPTKNNIPNSFVVVELARHKLHRHSVVGAAGLQPCDTLNGD